MSSPQLHLVSIGDSFLEAPGFVPQPSGERPPGMRWTRAADLDAGLSVLAREQVDAILLPASLALAGDETWRRLSSVAADLPILVISNGEIEMSRAAELLARGVQDILSIPRLRFEELVRAVRFAIVRHQRLVEARHDSPPAPPVAADRSTPDRNEVLLAQYRLLRLVGQGRSSVVFLAEPVTAPGERVAIKLLRLPASMSDEERTQWSARFCAEMALAPRLRHPHIVEVREVGVNESTGEPYLVMEYVDGRPLDRSRDFLGPSNYVQQARLFRQMAEALGCIHEHGVCHRDLKPANILVTAEGQIKIADFGMAISLDHGSDERHDRAGTPAYMAPEVYQQGLADRRSDVFSLGVVVYEWMLGQRPFTANLLDRLANQVQHDLPLEPRKIDPEFPVALQRILARMLGKQPDQRYQAVAELIEDIDAYLLDAAPPARRKGEPAWWHRTWA